MIMYDLHFVEQEKSWQTHEVNTDERLPTKLNPRLTEAMAKATSADVSLDEAGLKACDGVIA